MSPRSRSARSRCWIGRSPRSRRATTTCSRRWRCRFSSDHDEVRRLQRSGRGRRPPHRLADPQRRLRHGREARRVVRRAEVQHRPQQRRAVVDLDADLGADRRTALGEVLEELVALGCRLAEQHDAHHSRRRTRRLRRRRFLFDDQPPDAGAASAASGSRSQNQRMDAVIVVERRRRATCRKLRDVRPGDAVVCGVAGIRVMPEFQERDRHGFAFMTNEISSERRVEVGVSRIAAMMREIKASAAASPSWPVRWSCTPAGRSVLPGTDSRRLRRCAARRQRAGRARRRAGVLRHLARRRSRTPGRRLKAGIAITCAPSTRSAGPAA